MRITSISIFIVCSMLATSSGQTNLWSIDVTKDAIFSQLESGEILLKEDSGVRLLNNETGKELWSYSNDLPRDPEFLDHLPYVYFGGDTYAVINSLTGKVLDQSEIHTKILDIHYFWEESRVVFELKRKKKLILFNLNLEDEDSSWTLELGELRNNLFSYDTGVEEKPSITKDGTLVILFREKIKFVSPVGKLVDFIEFDDDIETKAFNKKNNTLYIIEDNEVLHFIDVTKTNVVHSTELKKSQFNLDFINDDQNLVIWNYKTVQVLNAKNGTVINELKVQQDVKDSYLTENGLAYYLVTKKYILEINQTTGVIEREKKFDKEVLRIIDVHEKLFIGKPYKLQELDLLSLDVSEGNGVDMSDIDDYQIFGDKVLYHGLNDYGYHFIMVDQNNEKIWRKKFTAKHPVLYDFTNSGILVISDNRVDHIDFKTGKSTWEDDIDKDVTYIQRYDQATNQLVIFSDKHLYSVDMETGRLREFEKKIKFKDFDYETQSPQLTILNESILIKGSNSIFIVKNMEDLVFENHFKKVNSSDALLKFAMLGIAVTAVSSGRGALISSVYSGGEEVFRGELVDALNASEGYAYQLEEKRRRMQNRGSNRNPYVYYKNEDKNKAFRFLKADSGEKTFEIEVEEKEPQYIVDDFDDIFYIIKEGELNAISIRE